MSSFSIGSSIFLGGVEEDGLESRYSVISSNFFSKAFGWSSSA